jgi:hypothetical protein
MNQSLVRSDEGGGGETMTQRREFRIRRLGRRAALFAVVVVAAAAWQHRFGQAAPAAADGGGTVLPLAGLAVPQTPATPHEPSTDTGRSVLTPSCSFGQPGACDRLAAICERLEGDMRANGDGTETCVIVID